MGNACVWPSTSPKHADVGVIESKPNAPSATFAAFCIQQSAMPIQEAKDIFAIKSLLARQFFINTNPSTHLYHSSLPAAVGGRLVIRTEYLGYRRSRLPAFVLVSTAAALAGVAPAADLATGHHWQT